MKESHKNPSLETRRKISETKKGHICSEETKKKIGNANRGRKHSEESIEKMRVAKHAKHAKFSEETKIKMSESHWKGGRKVSLERERNKRKNDVKYQLNRRISRGIRKCLIGGMKNHHHWCDLVGYDNIELRKRLNETMPEGYMWQDFLDGKLQIDHIIPISAFNFNNIEHIDFRRCWSLGNLRLLPVKENLSKHNKIIKTFQTSLMI